MGPKAAVSIVLCLVLSLAALCFFCLKRPATATAHSGTSAEAAPTGAGGETQHVTGFAEAVEGIGKAEGIARKAPDQPRAEELSIVSAKYGADESWIDVTEHLRKAIKDGRLVIAVGNSIAGDPAFGKSKILQVSYSLNGKRQSLMLREGQTLYIPPSTTSAEDEPTGAGAGGETQHVTGFAEAVEAIGKAEGIARKAPDQPRAEELSIVSAKYGADESWIDVTEHLQRAVKDGRLAIGIGNSIAGDPAFGKAKVLRVSYSLNGERRSLGLREGQALYIPPSTKPGYTFEVISNDSRLVSIAKACPAEIGLFGKNFATGRTITYQADQPACLASIVKIFVLLEVMRRKEAGTLDLKNTIEISGPDKTTKCTISEALDLMIGQSDNDATNTLAALVGYDHVNALPRQLGIEGLSEKIMPEPGVLATALDERVTGPRLLPKDKLLPQHGTARGIVRYFELLHERKLINDAISSSVLEVLNRNPEAYAPNATPLDYHSVGKGGSLTWIRPPRPRYEMAGWGLYIYSNDTALAFCIWGEWFPGGMTDRQRFAWLSGLSDCIVNLLLQPEHQPGGDDNLQSTDDANHNR